MKLLMTLERLLLACLSGYLQIALSQELHFLGSGVIILATETSQGGHCLYELLRVARTFV